MSDAPYADRAARLLRAGRATVGPRADAEPEAVIAALADAIRGSARRRRVRAWIVGGAVAIGSAAAAVVLSLGAHSPSAGHMAAAPGPAPAARSVPPAALSGFAINGPNGAPIAPGETLAARAEALVLSAADGTTVRVEPRSEITLVRADAIRWFQLQSGSLDAHVAKLAMGERFVVATPDRQVEVRGTRFHVSLVPADEACGGGSVTRVRVDEGVVTVRAFGGPEVRVEAGELWPTDCRPAARSVPAHPGSRAAPWPHRGHPPAEPGPSVAASTLGAENDLFAEAARAARAGDAAAALRALDQLVTRYPASPLRAPAEAERARIVSHAAPAAAPAAP